MSKRRRNPEGPRTPEKPAGHPNASKSIAITAGLIGALAVGAAGAAHTVLQHTGKDMPHSAKKVPNERIGTLTENIPSSLPGARRVEVVVKARGAEQCIVLYRYNHPPELAQQAGKNIPQDVIDAANNALEDTAKSLAALHSHNPRCSTVYWEGYSENYDTGRYTPEQLRILASDPTLNRRLGKVADLVTSGALRLRGFENEHLNTMAVEAQLRIRLKGDTSPQALQAFETSQLHRQAWAVEHLANQEKDRFPIIVLGSDHELSFTRLIRQWNVTHPKHLLSLVVVDPETPPLEFVEATESPDTAPSSSLSVP